MDDRHQHAVLRPDVAVAELRETIDRTCATAAFQGTTPKWSLPPVRRRWLRTSREGPDELRRRRAVALLLLGLPGSASYDSEAEHALHLGSEDPDGAAWSTRVSEAFDEIRRRGDGRRGSAEPAWERPRRGESGVLRHWTDPATTGGMHLVIANLGDVPAAVPDGSIAFASADPLGPLRSTSDNHDLPPMTTIWLAPK